MKKLLTMITAAVLLLSTTSFATNVNEKAKLAFLKDFYGATNVTWFEKDNFYLVEFKVEQVRFTAAYDEEGKLLASSKSIKLEDVPSYIIQAVNKKYPEYKPGMNVVELTVETQVTYQLTIDNNKELLYIKVDASGEISVEQTIKI